MKIGPVTIGENGHGPAPDPRLKDLREAVYQRDESLDMLVERIAELEFALEDEGWMRLGLEGQREFSREGLRKIIAWSRLSYLKNPLINRGVLVQAHYVWGQGVNIEARDPDVNDVVQAFLDDEKNQAEFTSHQQRTMKEIDLQVQGNLFFVYFTNESTGRVRVRTIPVDEIQEIICNPDDAKEHWYYRRVWTATGFDHASGRSQGERREEFYPDWRYEPANKPKTIGKHTVHWESPVQHVLVGGFSDMRFGVPEVYAALDWAKAHKEQLEDDASRSRSLARFAYSLTVKGGKDKVRAAKEKLNTTLGTETAGSETNPAPVVGSVFVGSDNAKLEPTNIANAMMPVDHSRPFKLMVCAALGLPETFFGDADRGSLATAKSLDRPTELMMRQRQTLWGDTLRDMFAYVIRKAAESPSGPLKGRLSVERGDDDVWLIRGVDVAGEEVDPNIDITWPSILEHDIAEQVRAIVSAATLDGKPMSQAVGLITVSRLLLSALGVDNVDEEIEDMFPGGVVPELPAPAAGEEPAFTEALRELRGAMRKSA